MCSHGVDVLDAKLKVLASELNELLPTLNARCGVGSQTAPAKPAS